MLVQRFASLVVRELFLVKSEVSRFFVSFLSMKKKGGDFFEKILNQVQDDKKR